MTGFVNIFNQGLRRLLFSPSDWLLVRNCLCDFDSWLYRVKS